MPRLASRGIVFNGGPDDREVGPEIQRAVLDADLRSPDDGGIAVPRAGCRHRLASRHDGVD
jgi:hypothetical protein